MLLPGLIFVILFLYLPILYNFIAFKDYKIFMGPFGSPWCDQPISFQISVATRTPLKYSESPIKKMDSTPSLFKNRLTAPSTCNWLSSKAGQESLF